MLAALRAICRRELDSLRVAYRHYRLERDRFARRTRVKHLSMAQEAMLAAVERQRDETVERQVRRLHEASRFVTKQAPRHDAND